MVSEGDSVAAGALLVKLDDAELMAMYDQALGALGQAQAARDLARKSFERTSKLLSDGFVSQQMYDQAKTNYDGALSAVKQAEAARDLAKIRLEDTEIRTPLDGYVTSKSIEEGELVSSGSNVITISQLSKVHIMLYVTEVEVGRVKLGAPVSITVDSNRRARYEGKVTYISSRAEFTPKNIQTRKERVTQVFAVKVEVPNSDLKLKPGLPADAVIKII